MSRRKTFEELDIQREQVDETKSGANSDKTNDYTCSICLEDFKESETALCLPQCHHRYHKECLRGWYDSNNDNCPMCRRPFSQPVEVIIDEARLLA